MKYAALAVIVSSTLSGGVAAQRAAAIASMDAAIKILESDASDRGREALDYVLAHLDMARAEALLYASMHAMHAKRIEDAGFLFYAAQLRTRVDQKRFPSVGKGGSDPAVALGALISIIGEEVNPAIMREPAAFAAAVKRLEAWDLKTAPNYDPGWKYTGALSAKEAEAATQIVRAEYMKPAIAISTLLNIPEYFAEFRIVQDANMTDFKDEKQFQAAQERAKQAEQRMRAIEEKMKIEGMYYKPPK